MANNNNNSNNNELFPNLTNEEIIKFKETFLQFDPTGSGDENTGSITIKDLPIAIRALGFSPTEAELKEMITEAENDVPLLDRLGK